MPTSVPIAKAIQSIKAGSSAWIHQAFGQLHNFSWQQGDSAFNRSTWRFRSGMSIRRAVACSCRGSVSKTNTCGTDHDFDRPSGTGALCIATQALRAWLLSACPSRTKAIRPGSQRLGVELRHRKKEALGRFIAPEEGFTKLVRRSLGTCK
jgi:hypothetical protein